MSKSKAIISTSKNDSQFKGLNVFSINRRFLLRKKGRWLRKETKKEWEVRLCRNIGKVREGVYNGLLENVTSRRSRPRRDASRDFTRKIEEKPWLSGVGVNLGVGKGV